MTNIEFGGGLRIDIAGQALSKAHQAIIQKALATGMQQDERVVRYSCRIAQDANAAIAAGIVDNQGGLWMPNPNARAQFGKAHDGEPFLSFGVLNESTGKRRSIRFVGDSVPTKMMEVAVRHDEGRDVRPTSITLNMSNALVYETGNKDGKGRAKKDKRGNHDRDKNGKPYARGPRRTHGRLCSADLAIRNATG